MSDARWIEVEDDVESACRHFANAVLLFDQGGFEAEGLSAYKARMALLHAMQSGHTSLEAALKRILVILGEEGPAGDYSHADLIKRAARAITTPGLERPAILTGDMARAADESRRFRHRATHDYDNFEPALAVPSIDAARILAAGLRGAVQAFQEIIDPPTDRH